MSEGAKLWRRIVRRLTWSVVVANGLGGLLMFLLLGFLVPFSPEGPDRHLAVNAIVAVVYMPVALLLGTLQLSTHYGFGQALILPAVLGGPLGLLERFDHRSLGALLAARRFAYWATTPLMADVLARAPLAGPPPPAPAICHVSAGKLAARTFHAFAARFGVALRPSYGQTENGFITVDTGAPAEGNATVRSPSRGVTGATRVAWSRCAPRPRTTTRRPLSPSDTITAGRPSRIASPSAAPPSPTGTVDSPSAEETTSRSARTMARSPSMRPS